MGKGLRWATVIAVSVVGLVAAVMSFRHQFDLALGHGESPLTARLLPLSVDGLLMAGTLAVLDASRKGSGARWARLTVASGIAMTIWANVYHGLAWGVPGVLVSAWPPVALILCVEVLAGMLRNTAPAAVVQPAVAETVTEPIPEPVPSASNGHSADAHRVLTECGPDAASLREIQRILSCGQKRAQRVQAEVQETRALAGSTA